MQCLQATNRTSGQGQNIGHPVRVRWSFRVHHKGSMILKVPELCINCYLEESPFLIFTEEPGPHRLREENFAVHTTLRCRWSDSDFLASGGEEIDTHLLLHVSQAWQSGSPFEVMWHSMEYRRMQVLEIQENPNTSGTGCVTRVWLKFRSWASTKLK